MLPKLKASGESGSYLIALYITSAHHVWTWSVQYVSHGTGKTMISIANLCSLFWGRYRRRTVNCSLLDESYHTAGIKPRFNTVLCVYSRERRRGIMKHVVLLGWVAVDWEDSQYFLAWLFKEPKETPSRHPLPFHQRAVGVVNTTKTPPFPTIFFP